MLETDASIQGLGAVLAQRQGDGSVKLVVYASRSLQAHERNYGITELEGLGVVWALKHFRTYLYGHHCDVFTDHSTLKSLLNTPQPSGKLAQWGIELNVTILHRAGKQNANADLDALSRSPLPDSSPAPCIPFGIVAAMDKEEDLKEPQRKDLSLMEIIDRHDGDRSAAYRHQESQAVGTDEHPARRCAVSRRNQWNTTSDSPRRIQRLDLFQQGVFGAHLREAKVYSELQRHYWWPGMQADIGR